MFSRVVCLHMSQNASTRVNGLINSSAYSEDLEEHVHQSVTCPLTRFSDLDAYLGNTNDKLSTLRKLSK